MGMGRFMSDVNVEVYQVNDPAELAFFSMNNVKGYPLP